MISLVKLINFIRPNAEWTLNGDSYDGLSWYDKVQTKPTQEEIENIIPTFKLQKAKKNKKLEIQDIKTTLKLKDISILINKTEYLFERRVDVELTWIRYFIYLEDGEYCNYTNKGKVINMCKKDFKSLCKITNKIDEKIESLTIYNNLFIDSLTIEEDVIAFQPLYNVTEIFKPGPSDEKYLTDELLDIRAR